MSRINYHHLLYFWTVVKEGSIAKACKILHLSQPAISTQLRFLEESLNEKLLEREGRGLTPTAIGRLVYRYADEIFSLGREMMHTLQGLPTGRALKLRVGISDVVPKSVAFYLLEPALHLAEPVQLVCYEDRIENLCASLSLHELDIIISDAPIPPNTRIRGFNHHLGDCGVSIVGSRRLARQYRRHFPKSLQGAPFLLPLEGHSLRQSLDRWFEQTGIRPKIQGEFQDSALLQTFGQEGIGLFAVPNITLKRVVKNHDVIPLGPAKGVTEAFYAISIERKLKHPGVVAIVKKA